MKDFSVPNWRKGARFFGCVINIACRRASLSAFRSLCFLLMGLPTTSPAAWIRHHILLVFLALFGGFSFFLCTLWFLCDIM
jgi:hypothetical protein